MTERERMLDRLFFAMARHDGGNPHRIQHLTKVHAFAAWIGRQEGLDAQTQWTLEAAALVHDIGIRPAEEQHGHHEGPLQEKLGAPLAKALLLEQGFTPQTAERVSWLVGHHHTYDPVEGIDHQILLEADMLVNLHEHGDKPEAVAASVKKVFRTKSGLSLAREMFGLRE